MYKDRSFVIFIAKLGLACFLMAAHALGQGQQKTGASNNGNQTGNQTQQSGLPSTSPASSGITSGTDPIESVIFAYQSLNSDAEAVSNQIAALVQKGDVVILTPADAAALIQWRTTMGQLQILEERVDEAASIAKPKVPQYSKDLSTLPQGQQGQQTRGLEINTPADVQTLAQIGMTLASGFAVNESLTPATGAITDTPLMDSVARGLRSSARHVYIPSFYTPSLLHDFALSNTFILDKLENLETDRAQLLSDAQQYLQALDDANFVATAGNQFPDGSAFQPDDITQAKLFVNRTKTVSSLETAISSVMAAIDTFEGTLFSGQSSAQIPNGNGTNGGGGTNNGNNNGNGNKNANGNQSAGNILQQVFEGDILAHAIWNGNIAPADLSSVHILTIHALESGGGVLTKGNFFYGTRQYFSGGSVVTFALFNIGGAVECSGFAYDYTGYIREKNVEWALRTERKDKKGQPIKSLITTFGSCTDQQDKTDSPVQSGPAVQH